mgnify:CR=1 FL=1
MASNGAGELLAAHVANAPLPEVSATLEYVQLYSINRTRSA